MPKFVIERDMAGAGKLSAQDLKGMAQKSCGVLREMGSQIQWVESYVTDDKIYRVCFWDGSVGNESSSKTCNGSWARGRETRE